MSSIGRLIVAGIFLLLCLPGCAAAQVGPGHLTPTAEATLKAYQPGDEITNPTDAEAVARQSLAAPHFKPYGPQTMIWVEKLRKDEAVKRVSTEIIRDDTLVWLVVFKGQTQITIPGAQTPNPPIDGCSYIILPAQKPFQYTLGGIKCELVAQWQKAGN